MNAIMNLEVAIFTTAVGLKSPMYEIVHRKEKGGVLCPLFHPAATFLACQWLLALG